MEKELIDLGLSVNWASCNIGATKPEEFGGYYQWGGLEDISKFNYFTDAPYRNSNILDPYRGWFKYNTKKDYGTVDNKIVLELSDDVVNVTWGGNWRMPTKKEWIELEKSCTWTWTTINNINGYKVTSKKRGYTDNSIFLPAAGFQFNGTMTFNFINSRGFYWSSSLCTAYPSLAWGISISSYDIGKYCGPRFNYFPIRPVKNKI